MTYLRCSNNNRASTVLQCFQEAISTYSVPSRVRCDYGVENVDVARFMLETRGTDRSSIITGSSVHNQRVERLWRDVRRIVVRQYQNVFHYLETSDLLDPLNDLHLFCLHHVFIPRINRALKEFVRQHNSHPIRTEHCYTPEQLFYTPYICGYVEPFYDPPTVNPTVYGLEEDGPFIWNSESDNAVMVDPPRISLPHQQQQLLDCTVPPLEEDDNFGISLYSRAVQTVQQFLSS